MEGLIESMPPKDATELKEIIELYDSKKYSKGLKKINKLLEKSPNSLEFQALQALFKFFLPEENVDALALMKGVLMKNLKSSFSWQVYGMIQQNKMQFKDAAKSFEQALKSNPKSPTLLRDTANLYLHCRELIPHREIRRRLLLAKPGVLQNWASYAISLHLLGQFSNALEVVDDFLAILVAEGPSKHFEISNVMTYRAVLLKEAGKWAELEKYIEKEDEKIKDSTVKLSLLFECAVHLGRDDKKKLELLEKRMKMNSDNTEVILEWLKVNGKSSAESLEILVSKYKSSVAHTLFLEKVITDEAEWEKLFCSQLVSAGRKFVPSFARVICKLSEDPKRKAKILDILSKTLESIRTKGTFLDSEENEDPTAELFVILLLAQFHFDQKDFAEAAKLAREASEHTPSYEDAFLIEARARLKLGQFEEACQAARDGQILNRADRGLTNNAALILFKAGRIEEAETLYKKFLKGTPEEIEKNIFDLHMLEFQRQRGKALFKAGYWTEGLRQLSHLQAAVKSFFGDQYDFYSYSLRKFGMIPLLEIIRFNDRKIAQTPLFVKGNLDYLEALVAYQKLAGNQPRRYPVVSGEKTLDLAGDKIDLKFVASEIEETVAFLKKQAKSVVCDKLLIRIHTLLFDHFAEKGHILAAARSLNFLLAKKSLSPKLKHRAVLFKEKAKAAEGVLAEVVAPLLASLDAQVAELTALGTKSWDRYATLISEGKDAELEAAIKEDTAQPEKLAYPQKKKALTLLKRYLCHSEAYLALYNVMYAIPEKVEKEEEPSEEKKEAESVATDAPKA